MGIKNISVKKINFTDDFCIKILLWEDLYTLSEKSHKVKKHGIKTFETLNFHCRFRSQTKGKYSKLCSYFDKSGKFCAPLSQIPYPIQINRQMISRILDKLQSNSLDLFRILQPCVIMEKGYKNSTKS